MSALGASKDRLAIVESMFLDPRGSRGACMMSVRLMPDGVEREECADREKLRTVRKVRVRTRRAPPRV